MAYMYETARYLRLYNVRLLYYQYLVFRHLVHNIILQYVLLSLFCYDNILLCTFIIGNIKLLYLLAFQMNITNLLCGRILFLSFVTYYGFITNYNPYKNLEQPIGYNITFERISVQTARVALIRHFLYNIILPRLYIILVNIVIKVIRKAIWSQSLSLAFIVLTMCTFNFILGQNQHFF